MFTSSLCLALAIFATPVAAKSAIADTDAIIWLSIFGVLMCICCAVVMGGMDSGKSYAEFDDNDIELGKTKASFRKMVADRNLAQMPKEERAKIQGHFDNLDEDKSGALEEAEVVDFFVKIASDGQTEEQVRAEAKESLKQVGSNGKLSFEQFATLWHLKLMVNEEWLQRVFESLDTQNTATLDPASFGDLFPNASQDKLEQVKSTLTLNENGMMGFDEFKQSVKN